MSTNKPRSLAEAQESIALQHYICHHWQPLPLTGDSSLPDQACAWTAHGLPNINPKQVDSQAAASRAAAVCCVK